MMTVADHFTVKIANQVHENPEDSLAINEIYQFNITGQQAGCYTVNLKESLSVVEGENPAATCVITIADEDFIGLMTGEKNGMELFATGKIQIERDLMAALKLERLFSLGGD